MTPHRLQRLAFLACLFLGPLFQLIGDALWLTGRYNFSWNIYREAANIFFIPSGFLFAKLIGRKSFLWAVTSCAFFVIGCLGCTAMMSLFRLGDFYQTNGHYAFSDVVTSAMGKNFFGETIFLPGLCFPFSLVLFGIGFLKYRVTKIIEGISFIISGILFWLGNAGEMETCLIIGDFWLLWTFCYLGYLMFSEVNNWSTTGSVTA